MLTLTKGYIATTSANILNMADGSSTSGTSASSFVDGPMTKAGSTAFTFPLGDGTRWARLGIGTTTVSTTFQAEYFATTYSNTVTMATAPTPVLTNVSKLEYWQLDRTGTGDATVTLYWEDADWSEIIDCTTDDLRVAHWCQSCNGGSGWWENNNEAVTTTGTCNGVGLAGTVSTSTAVASFSPFTFGSKGLNPLSPLPISLLSFSAECSSTPGPSPKERGVTLKWATASEENNDYFEIQRAAPYNSPKGGGLEFVPIGTVKGAGNSSTTRKYSFIG